MVGVAVVLEAGVGGGGVGAGVLQHRVTEGAEELCFGVEEQARSMPKGLLNL